jgi:hypothetical protein
MKLGLRTALAWLLAFSILTLWVLERWAVSGVQVGIFLMAAMWLAGVVVHKYPIRWSWVFIPLTGVVVWGCAQLAFGETVYRWATGNAVLDWGARLSVFFVALQVYDDAAARRRLLRALLWFGFGLSVVASLQLFLTPGKVFGVFETGLSGGVMGPFLYHNQYAAFVETIMPLAVLGAVEERTGRLLYVVMAGAMIASVVASTSRAGTVAVMAETVAVLWLARMRRKGRRVGLVLGGTALFVVIFGATVGWGTLWTKLQRADPYAQRRELLYSSLRMAADRPWMGFGLGTWAAAYPAYADFDDGLYDNQAHNDWVQWAAEGNPVLPSDAAAGRDVGASGDTDHMGGRAFGGFPALSGGVSFPAAAGFRLLLLRASGDHGQERDKHGEGRLQAKC